MLFSHHEKIDFVEKYEEQINSNWPPIHRLYIYRLRNGDQLELVNLSHFFMTSKFAPHIFVFLYEEQANPNWSPIHSIYI